MGRRKKDIVWPEVPITGWASKGKALAKVEGMAVFVQGAVPGDVADLRVMKQRKKYAEAKAIRLHTLSPDRVEPFCAHFGVCGGCKWQDLAYEKQLAFKHQEVVDQLERLGGLDLPEVPPTLGSPRTTHYRNKLEFTAGSSRWFTTEELRDLGDIADRTALGFHIPQRFDRILEVTECHLQPEPSNSIRQFVARHARAHGFTFYDAREHTGFLRNLTVRTATTGEVMVMLHLGHEDVSAREALLDALVAEFPQLTSVLWVINPKRNDTIWDLDVHTFHGRDHIVEELPDGPGGAPLKFRIGPKTFFQTNPEQTVHMYRLVRDLASLTGKELVYDLYCGAGSITLFVAAQAARVVGAEIVPEAVADAERNAALNGVQNVAFEAGDLKDLLGPDFVERHGRPDVVIADPPRAGMHEDVVRRIRELAPERIVYVSCNPATQARDLALLKDLYTVDHVQPVDMFPHTYHVENVVRLIKRKG